MAKLERDYQASLIKRIQALLPGCVILKNDSGYQQGIPDLSVFYRDRYAILEVKKSADEKPEPNQEYFVDLFDTMSFGAFIYPENEEEVLHDLQLSFRPRRRTRRS